MNIYSFFFWVIVGVTMAFIVQSLFINSVFGSLTAPVILSLFLILGILDVSVSNDQHGKSQPLL